jgi:hypothetical protein
MNDTHNNAFLAGQLLAFLVNELRDLDPDDPVIDLQIEIVLRNPVAGIERTIRYLHPKHGNRCPSKRAVTASRIAKAMGSITSLEASSLGNSGEFLRGYYQNLTLRLA